MGESDSGLGIVHLLREVTVELALLQSEFARANGMHATDVRALICVLDAERAGDLLTPGRLGAQLGLNSAGTTSVIDRLERAGHLRRLHDPDDRRRVRLRTTEQAVTLGQGHFGPLIAHVLDLLGTFDEAEVAAVRRFLTSVRDTARDRGPR
ncbi:MarR family winged helix-turn-helix transcriptional regulator [Streptomyces sp. NPDC014748]|uniref:MarR family winged helix-turn-helix transcriptional regulator n=1 Tax=unclassified Streptomyces TaxID=2593676 RepID=UPI0013CBBE09|nr:MULTISPECIES: MarR family transcriptional regulator [unclassified Streptomyces]NED32614.1 MarR family transcriptional regulator [Streptomyces sp. SID8499]NMO34701.1 MarR family transcriptional regulator [Streptomyces sp. GMY02]